MVGIALSLAPPGSNSQPLPVDHGHRLHAVCDCLGRGACLCGAVAAIAFVRFRNLNPACTIAVKTHGISALGCHSLGGRSSSFTLSDFKSSFFPEFCCCCMLPLFLVYLSNFYLSSFIYYPTAFIAIRWCRETLRLLNGSSSEQRDTACCMQSSR